MENSIIKEFTIDEAILFLKYSENWNVDMETICNDISAHYNTGETIYKLVINNKIFIVYELH